MGRGEVAAIPVQLLDGVAEQIGSQKVRVSEHPGRIKRDFAWTIGSDHFRKEPAGFGGEKRIRLANRRRAAKDGFAHGGVQASLQPWNDLEPDEVPRGIGPKIGRIDAVSDSVPPKIIEHLVSRDREERPHDSNPAHKSPARHARESAQSRPPEQSKKDGLGLVIRGVRRRDSPRSRLFCELAKRIGPSDSRGLLRPMRRDRQPAFREPHVPAPGQVPHEGKVGVRFLAAQAMVDVADHEPGRAPESSSVGGEEVEERHGIWSPGDRDQEGVSDREQCSPLDRPGDGPFQRGVPRIGTSVVRRILHGASIRSGEIGRAGDEWWCKLVAAQGFEPRTKRL